MVDGTDKMYGVVENEDNNDSDILWVRASE